MAVRQYIGARYVPKFIGEWNNTTIYNALEVVDNGSGTSYIARKTVPAGTPLSNSEYWFIYGASSGAILNLQEQIDDMKDGNMSGSLQNQINEVADETKQDIIVVIGDSWAAFDERTTYPDRTKWLYDRMQNNPNIYNYAVGGAGVATFAAQLDQAKADTNYNNYRVKKIVIIGGVNDYVVGNASGTVASTINNLFLNYQDDFPNADYVMLFDCFSPLSISGSHTFDGCRTYFKSISNSVIIPCYFLGYYLLSSTDFEYSAGNSYHLSENGSDVMGHLFDQIINGLIPSLNRSIGFNSAHVSFGTCYGFNAGGSETTVNVNAIVVNFKTTGNNCTIDLNIGLTSNVTAKQIALQVDFANIYTKYAVVPNIYRILNTAVKGSSGNICQGNPLATLFTGTFGVVSLTNALFIYMNAEMNVGTIIMSCSID